MTAYSVGAKRRAKAAQKSFQSAASVCALSGVPVAAGKDAPVRAEKEAMRETLANEPTAERRAKGAMRRAVVKSPRGETVVWVDDRPTPLRECLESNKLASRQVLAGERFEQLVNAVHSIAGYRSCLDVTIRGNGEYEPERAARLFAEWKSVVQQMGLERSRIVMSVAVLHEPTGDRREKARRFRLLREGLDMVADFYGYPLDDAA